ncbi:MATE family efflux transporter [Dethiobacter alkaliphilus]|uniref:Multidrug export protein MepA n=1 Tax=Dethiobacter alkaliphilus AHT 1 TaxID=555088 RepID=C0GJ49_DETAL|nr:MATE family efflux transporter [Dethiobacter alkaliphilus]EEG76682.1 MATE efflux family protein [Dethiobacter alkaliphilus AHT 1]MCW3489187.1 MATE family efflux transporter [Dethiobacter alkaliphilus]
MATNKPADMGTDSIPRLLVRFSLPATLAMVVNASYNIIDTIFVGRLGSDAIAALSVSFPIQMLLGALAIGTGVGVGSLISRSLGAGKNEDAATAAGQVITLSFLFGLFATILGLLYLRPILLLFGARPEILELTASYMAVIANGAVLLFMIMILNHSIRAEGNAMLPMTVMILSAVTNIALDPIFIFVLDMGVQGAAVATVISKVIGVAMLLHYYLAKKSVLRVRLTHLLPDLRIITDIYRVGLPMLFIQLGANIALIWANRLLGSYGVVPIAVLGIIVRLQLFAFMPAIGIAQGLLPIIGYNFGAGKLERIREAMLKGSVVATAFTAVSGLSFFLFPGFFLRIFSAEPELLAVGETAVRIMVSMYPLLGIQTTAIVFFQAIGKGMPSLWLSLLRQFFLFIIFMMILERYFGLTGIWFAMPLADLLAFILTVFMVLREFRKYGIPLLARTNKKRPVRDGEV